MSLFTKQELTAYYIITTRYVCLTCQETVALVPGQKIMVETLHLTNDTPGSIPLSSLIERFGRAYDLTYEAASQRLPKLPFYEKEMTHELTFCRKCKGVELGCSDTGPGKAFPPMLPHAMPLIHEDVKSPNDPEVESKYSKQRKQGKHSKHRSLESEGEKLARQKRLKELKEIKTGDVSSLQQLLFK